MTGDAMTVPDHLVAAGAASLASWAATRTGHHAPVTVDPDSPAALIARAVLEGALPSLATTVAVQRGMYRSAEHDADLTAALTEEVRRIADRLDHIPLPDGDRFTATAVRQVAEHLRTLADLVQRSELT